MKRIKVKLVKPIRWDYKALCSNKWKGSRVIFAWLNSLTMY